MDRLYRSEDDKVLGGVCGGIAEKYELDPSLVRLATLVIVLTAGIGLPLYLAAWLIVPPESELENQEEAPDTAETGDSDEESESEEEE
ncbi:PspC domain-containing protein [Nanohaloarchaea archaeon]|nr:PspC domain-containing protein [Candidatus Nanohaloarchaea archaeon]